MESKDNMEKGHIGLRGKDAIPKNTRRGAERGPAKSMESQ
jgi:hypothetical protein